MDKGILLEKIFSPFEELSQEEDLQFRRLLLTDPEFHKKYLERKRIHNLIASAFNELNDEIAVIVNDEVSFFPKTEKIDIPLFTSDDLEEKHVVVIKEGDIVYEDTFTSEEDYPLALAADTGEEDEAVTLLLRSDAYEDISFELVFNGDKRTTYLHITS